MGDRSAIAIEQYNGSRVYLYGHWMGEGAIEVVSDTLDRGLRWDDSSYLARLMFERMIRDSAGSETGFGISAVRPDVEYPIIVLNCEQKMLTVEGGSFTSKPVSFSIFIQSIDHDTFENVLQGIRSHHRELV
jgi:hypothetical protein